MDNFLKLGTHTMFPASPFHIGRGCRVPYIHYMEERLQASTVGSGSKAKWAWRAFRGKRPVPGFRALRFYFLGSRAGRGCPEGLCSAPLAYQLTKKDTQSLKSRADANHKILRVSKNPDPNLRHFQDEDPLHMRFLQNTVVPSQVTPMLTSLL